MVPLTCEWFKLTRGAFLRFQIGWICRWVGRPSVTKFGRNMKGPWVSICQHSCGTSCKINFFKAFPLSWEESTVPLSEEGVPNIMHTDFTAPAWKWSLKFSSIFGHRELPRTEEWKAYLIYTPKFFFPAWMRGFTEAGHFFFTAETSNSFA